MGFVGRCIRAVHESTKPVGQWVALLGRWMGKYVDCMIGWHACKMVHRLVCWLVVMNVVIILRRCYAYLALSDLLWYCCYCGFVVGHHLEKS